MNPNKIQTIKVFALLFLLVISFAFLGCAPKKAELSNFYRVYEQEIEPEVSEDLPIIPEPEENKYSNFKDISPSDSVEDTHYNKHSELDRLLTNSKSYINNEKVEYYLKIFQTSHRRSFVRWLERSAYYTPELKQLLANAGVPKSLAYLPLIESGYNPNAVSPKHAVGLWQFIKPTGRRYGLEVNFWVDERRDYKKATVAASQYLKDLYKEFDSWELALAGYNCGEARVRKGIKKTRSNDFWVVSKTLPRETRNYVPKFIASLIIAMDPEKYGFESVRHANDKKFVKVFVPPGKSLRDIARIVGYKYKEIKSHNPFLIRGITPPGSNSHLYIKPSFVKKFARNKRGIANLRKTTPRRSVYTAYTVKRGDNLWVIAKKFGVRISSIKSGNKLKSDRLRPGQKLIIRRSIPVYSNAVYVVRKGDTVGEIAEKFGVRTSSLANRNGLRSSRIRVGQKLEIPIESREVSNSGSGIGSGAVYVVRKGDTVGEIAEKFGVRTSSLANRNGLRSSRIRVGQKLEIPIESREVSNSGSGIGSGAVYVVRKGDTVGEIAEKFGVRTSSLANRNGLRSSRIRVGQKLEIPIESREVSNSGSGIGSGAVYVVRKGDTVGEIAEKFGVRTSSLANRNGLRSSRIRVGQKLEIPIESREVSNSGSGIGSGAVYVVRKGDTVGEIAEKFGVRTSSLANRNGLRSSRIKAGQKLEIPLENSKGSINHDIKHGDTLSEIAVQYSVSINDIKKWNNLRTTKLTAGKNLKIYR